MYSEPSYLHNKRRDEANMIASASTSKVHPGNLILLAEMLVAASGRTMDLDSSLASCVMYTYLLS